jgi:uncharacterized membrane protein
MTSSTARADGRGSSKVRRWRDRRRHHLHPVDIVHYDQATLGEHVADRVAGAIGSWPFLVTQTVVVSIWVVMNIVGFARRWDPYPVILLNLLFALQAAYAGPVILLASNRQAQRVRLALEHADTEADDTGQRTLTIMDDIRRNIDMTARILQHLQAGQELPQTGEGVAAAHEPE